jgi:hypothetical protein
VSARSLPRYLPLRGPRACRRSRRAPGRRTSGRARGRRAPLIVADVGRSGATRRGTSLWRPAASLSPKRRISLVAHVAESETASSGTNPSRGSGHCRLTNARSHRIGNLGPPPSTVLVSFGPGHPANRTYRIFKTARHSSR